MAIKPIAVAPSSSACLAFKGIKPNRNNSVSKSEVFNSVLVLLSEHILLWL